MVEQAADDVRVRRAEEQVEALRRYAEARYGAKSWRCQRRVAARIEATSKGLDIRFVVTNIAGGSAEWLYDTLYCPGHDLMRLDCILSEDRNRATLTLILDDQRKPPVSAALFG